jgi:leucyl-tRNA synthetase
MVPHFSAEMWHRCGHNDTLEKRAWPSWDEEAAKEDMLTIVVQINGKVRSRLEVAADIEDDSLKKLAVEDEKVARFLDGSEIKKIIVIKKKLVNIVL